MADASGSSLQAGSQPNWIGLFWELVASVQLCNYHTNGINSQTSNGVDDIIIIIIKCIYKATNALKTAVTR